MSNRAHAYIRDFTETYVKKLPASLAARQQAWPALADPRRSMGYMHSAFQVEQDLWMAAKKMCFPVVGARAEGAYLWDIDGHRYVDFVNGFGVHLFGHRPPFLVEALRAQLERGVPPIGMQSDQANEAARRIAAMTGAERVAFATSGTEANMVAVRLARAASGRDKIAVFALSYHGFYDDVIPSLGLTLGLSSSRTSDVLVLEYGDPRSLEIIAEHASELAAVLVEPVQSRQPGLQPAQFLKDLRQLTADKDIALVFDDVLLGFRIHQGGSQAYFDIRADMTTYGKTLGCGTPMGVITGSARYLDFIDGGYWQDDDESRPGMRRIWGGGTYAKNPMTLAATCAVLSHLEAAGNELQERLSARTRRMVDRLNAWLVQESMPTRIDSFGSIFRFVHAPEMNLLIPHLILRGFYTFEAMTFFVSTAHSDGDLESFIEAVQDSLLSMRKGGYIP